MHQSSLGALMLLAGDRVHPLWQTPILPLLYVWAAAYMGFSCVAGTLLFTSLVWERHIDLDILSEMNRITAGLIAAWSAVRLMDLIVRGQLLTALTPDRFAFFFWLEMVFLLAGAALLQKSARDRDPKMMFNAHLLAAIGGMLYRFNPTTLAFQPKPGAFYFPSAIELLISVGFVSLAIAGFSLAVKKLAILPAPVSSWYAMETREMFKQQDLEVAKLATANSD